MKKDNNIVELIKNKDLNGALKKMESIIKEILLDKLKKENINFKEDSIIEVLDVCIDNFPDEYDLLTYLRNILFFSDITDSERLSELANIYEIIKQEE